MGTLTADYRDAIEHLPDGATLIIHQVGWDDYERLLEDLAERPHRRVSYDCGKLEIMAPLPEHEEYGRFIDDVVRVLSKVYFYKLAGNEYQKIPASRSFIGLTPTILADTLEQSKTEGQTVALRAFRERWRSSSS